MEANGINYYKGVLLCSRPNESPSITKKREFCGRVYPHDQLGIGPLKHYDEHTTTKRVLPVLSNHKKWLQKFKKGIHENKQKQEKQKEKASQHLEKIKQDGYAMRESLKSGLIETNNSKKEENQSPPKLPEPNLKKKQKPAWAKTAKQAQKSEQKEVDQLLDFFNKQQQTELKDYISDGDVKTILSDLKTKIEKLKEQNDWRKEQIKKIEDQRNQSNQQKQKDKDDILSRISKKSGAQSITSQRTAERIQELEKKKKDVEWDKLTSSQKKNMANVDQQIAKNIADEVLRNYPNLKHHSNQSIRQLLQMQAQEQIKT